MKEFIIEVLFAVAVLTAIIGTAMHQFAPVAWDHLLHAVGL